MKKIIYAQLGYLSIWIVFFQIARIVFYLLQKNPADILSTDLFLAAALQGLKLDLSFSAYLSILPFLFFSTLFLSYEKSTWSILKIYHLAFTTICSIIIIADIGLFPFWRYRINSSVLVYLNSPKEAFTTSLSSPLPLFFICFVVLILLNQMLFKIYKGFIIRTSTIFPKLQLWLPVGLLGTACLILPLRGGLQLSPINQSSVFFSNNLFANQTSINACWNFFDSVVNLTYGKENPFVYFKQEQAKQFAQTIESDEALVPLEIGTDNVLIIVWESLTSKMLDKSVDEVEILPHLNQLKKESIYFSNCFATGDRSDKGLVGILSGFQAQPLGSIMTITSKASKLPVLAKDFSNSGYETAFFYGGEPEFANIKSYLVSGGFQKLVTKDDFEDKLKTSKWGVHDEFVLNRLLKETNLAKKPFFYTCFTLSSHEPFEVPMPTKITGNEEVDKFQNAHIYTDQALHNFLEEAKLQEWWQNTLVIIVADHGHSLPFNKDRFEDFRIPMIWTGGLIKKPRIFNDPIAQTDLARTLLTCFDFGSEVKNKYVWSNNFDPLNDTNDAFFAFNMGFGYVNNNQKLLYDDNSKRFIWNSAPNNSILIKKALAIQQASYQDFLDK